MKKSSKLFSFLAVLLCAFMLFGSVGSFQKPQTVVEAASDKYEKVVSFDTIKNLDVSGEHNYYVEYGEYPQSGFVENDNNHLKGLMNDSYGTLLNKYPQKSINTIYDKRTKTTNENFSYDESTGYFTAKKDISLPSGAVIKKGEKIYEYISGVNALEKYPVYAVSSTTEYRGDDKNANLRSATVHAELGNVAAGTYYGSSYTKCSCTYCGGNCRTSNSVRKGNYGSITTVALNDLDPIVEGWYSTSAMKTAVGGWLRDHTNVVTITFTDPDELNPTTSYVGLSDYEGTYYTFNKNGGLVPYETTSNTENGYKFLDGGSPRSEKAHDGISHSERDFASSAYDLIKKKLGVSNGQIYQIYVSDIAISNSVWDLFKDDFTFHVWVMNDVNSCAYCLTGHNKGSATTHFDAKQYAYGDNAYESVNTVNGQTVASGSPYYYKVEPIKWRVIENNQGELTLQSTLILDSMYYNLYTSNGTNFMQSYLRNWLNNGSPNFKGYYNVIDTQSSSTGRNESINTNSYRYTISGQTSTYDKTNVLFKNQLSGNIAALSSKTREYVSDKPSFFKMAFSNPATADTSLMTTFNESHVGLMMGFTSDTMTITPGKAESDKNPGRIYSENYVIIPNSVTAPVKTGTDPIRLEAKNDKVYTDFAAATGLVSRYSADITTYTRSTNANGHTSNINYSNQNGTNSLLWLSGGYQSISETTRGTTGRTSLKTLAVAYSSDEGASSSSNFIPQGSIRQLNIQTPFNRMDQSAGILPIIKLNMNKYGSSHYFKQVKEREQDKADMSTGTVITASGVALDQGSYLQTIALQNTVNTKLSIHSYEYLSGSKLRINFTATTGWSDNVDYIRISLSAQEEGTNKIGNAVFANAVRYYAISPSQLKNSTDQAYTHYVTLENISMKNVKLSSGNATDINLSNAYLKQGEFRVYVSLVTDNETKEYAIKENQIKFVTATLTAVSSNGSTPSVRYLYEGQTITMSPAPLADGVYSNWYWDSDCNTKAINAWVEGSGKEATAGSQSLWYSRTSGWKGTEKGEWNEANNKFNSKVVELKPASTTDIQLYYQTELGKYTINVGGTVLKTPDNLAFDIGDGEDVRIIPEKASDVLYIDYDASAGTYTPVAQTGNQDNLIKTATENILGGRAGDGSETKFNIYIKGMYANQFTTIDDLLLTYEEMTKNPLKAKGIVSFTTYNNNDSKNTSISDQSLLEESSQWTYTMEGGVIIEIAAPVKNMLSGSEIVDTVSYEITVKNVNPANVYTNNGNTSAVALTIIFHAYNSTSSNEDIITLANLTQDMFTMKMESSFNKTDLHGVVTSTENTEANGQLIGSYDSNGNPFTGAEGQKLFSQESRGTLEYNTKLTADVKFKTGYSLASNAFNQTGVTLPTMTLGFATQVMDDNGYRLSEDKRYPSNYANSYANSNIRLDALGRQIDFDNNDNLKMYYQTANANSERSTTTQTENKNGAYFGTAGGYKFAYAPLLSLHRESEYLGHQIILFVPRIKTATTVYYLDELNHDDFSKIGEYSIVYHLADFDTEGEKLVDTWKVAESPAALIEKYANDNLQDDEVFTIETTGTDAYGRSAGVMDRWIVKKNGSVVAGLAMTRSQAESEKKKQVAPGDNYTTLYLDAEYLYYNFTTVDQSFYARLVNNSNYEIEYTATKGQSINHGFVDETFGAQTIVLTPIMSNAVSYEPWNIYVKSTLNTQSQTKTITDDYTLYTVSTGARSELWGNAPRQYFMSFAGGNAQILNINSAGYPVANVNGINYIVHTDASGAYKLYVDNGSGAPSANPATGVDGYIVSYAQPVTVSLYEVKTDEKLNTLNSNNTNVYYSKGDTFIRIEINNVVSNVLFTFDENSITEHQYPVRFYSTFGQGSSGYQDFGTGNSMGSVRPYGIEIFNTSIISGSNISALNGPLREDVDSLSTVATAKDGTLIFKPYVRTNAVGNNTHYYYLAPITNVAGNNNEGLIAEVQDSQTTYLIKNEDGEQALTRVNDYQYTLNGGDTYFFTPNVYQFVGWKWNGLTSGGTANIGTGYLDYSTMYESDESNSSIVDFTNKSYFTSNNSDDDKEDFITTEELRRIIFNFKNSANELHFIAVYQPLDLKITFNSWNMTEDTANDGMYDVIAHAQEEANATDDPADDATLDALFNGNSVKGVQYGQKIAWSPASGVGQKIEEIVDNYLFNGQNANSYGDDEGWYRQVPNAKEYVENNILAQNLLTFANIDAVRQAIIDKSYSAVAIWDNRQFFTNISGTLYFTIDHYTDGYVAEVYEKMDFATYTFTDNTNLYRIYETANKTVTNGFDAEKFMASSIPTSVVVGQDLTLQFRLDSAYSDALLGKNGETKKVTEFVKSLTINATTRYNLGAGNHVISVNPENNSNIIELTTESGDYYWAIAYTGEGSERVDYAYVTISQDCRTITITILGVIGEVNVSSTYSLPKNRASVTFLNPNYDADGQPLADGKGAVMYGVFTLVDAAGNTSKTLTFDGTGETSFSLDGVSITIAYEEGYRKAVVTFDYGYNLYFIFERNAAFSNYLSNNRPFAVYAGETSVGTFSNTAFDAENSEVLFRYQAVDGNDAQTKYLMMGVTRELTLNWTAITINTYKLNGNSDAINNGDFYTATLDTTNTDPATGKNVAIYNETLDIVFELKEAYTNFVPTLTYGNHLVVFAHRYPYKADGQEFAQGDSQQVYYASSESSYVTLKRVAGVEGRDEHFAYEYTNSSLTRYYRVYFNAESDAPYAGYYKVTWALDSASTENVLGYIKYDELNNKYMFKNVETKADIVATLSSHYKDNGALKAWSSVNKNTYSITLDKNFVANDAYKVEVSKVTNSNNDWPEATVNRHTAESAVTVPAIGDADSVTLVNFDHGTKVRFRVKMNAAYTQTLPNLQFLIAQKDSKILAGGNTLASKLVDGIKQAFTMLLSYDVNDPTATERKRTMALNVGNLEITITQIFTYDKSFDNWGEFVEEAGIKNTTAGTNQDGAETSYDANEFLRYIAATYVIDIEMKDSFSLSNNPSSVYTQNKYYIIFNKYTEADGQDYGPLKFVSQIATNTDQYKKGKQYYYYQVVNHNEVAKNPFTEGGVAPDKETPIDASTFKSAEIEGFTYSGADGANARFKIKNSAGSYVNYSFGAVTGHAVLYAPFVEEEYNLRLNVPGRTTNANYEKYGEMYYMESGKTSFGSSLTSSSTASSTVKYSKTTFTVKYQMYSAYDNSAPVFVVSQYGELKYTEGVYSNVIQIGGSQVTVEFSVNKTVDTDKETYYYYINGNNVATVVKNTATYSNATNRDNVLSTSYVLTLNEAIDAGDSITVDPNTTISVSVNINKGTESETDQSTGLNTYNVTLYKPGFEEVTVNHFSSTSDSVQKTLKKYTAWTEDNYPTSGWAASKTYRVIHGTTLTLPTDTQDTNYFAFDEVNGYVCNGWYAEKTAATGTPTLAGPGARLTGVARNYNLYAKYRELERTITPILDNKYNQNYSDLFDDMSTSKGSVKYYSAEGSEAKVTFTLGAAYSQNENLTFAVNNTAAGDPTAIITGIAFDAIKGMYTLTLNYVIGDVLVGVSTEPTPDKIIANIYDITFHTYTYTSSYDSVNGWTQSVEEDGYDVWNNGNIIQGIKHGEVLSNKVYNTITLTSPTHEGLINSRNRWAYVIRGAESWDTFKVAKFQEIVIATLDDFDGQTQNSDGWIYEDADGNEYQIGLFTLDTQITGNMVVFPYYERTIYNVKVVERIESFATGEGVGADNSVSDEYHGTFALPYGYPVISDAVENYDGSAYAELITIDDFARDNIGVTSGTHYTFLGYYVNGDLDYRTGLEAILVSADTTEIVIDYYRNRYQVSFANSWNDNQPIATFEMPYGSAITDDTIVNGQAFSLFLAEKYEFATAANGKHLESWATTDISNNFLDEDCTIDYIACNVTFFPNVAANRYSVKVQGGEGFTEAMSNNSVHIGSTIPSRDSEGFFALDADSQLTIEYIATEGYEAHPYLVFALSRDGQEDETHNDTYWMAKADHLTFNSEAVDGGRIKWTITFDGKYDHSILRHGDKIVIMVNQTSSALAVDTTRSNFGDIVVDNGITPITFTYKEGDLVTPGNSVVRGAYVYSMQQIPVVEFLYESVSYGTDFTFIVRIDSKYAKGSTFKFTLSAGEGKTGTFELDQAHIDNTASSSEYSQYKFTLSQIKESVVVTIDTTSTFVANEFKITYYHAFGGGINKWVVTEVSNVIVTKDTVVSVKPGTGSHAPSPSAIANYTLISSAWLVQGNAEENIYNGHLGVTLDGYTEARIRDEFTTYSVQTYPYQADISVYAFYIVDQYDVTPEQSADNKGSFNLPGEVVDGKYSADKKVDSMTNAQGYTFSYEISAKYSKNNPVISVVKNNGSDLIILDVNKLVEGEVLEVEKSATVKYLVEKTEYGYTYRKGTNALGSTAEASVYYVVVEDGVYTLRQGDGHSTYDQTPVVATASVEGTVYTVTLATVDENFSLAVNDEMFEINAYTIKFIKTDGTTETVSANHGTKLTNIPTAEANFIQKVVYVVTYADNTTAKLSSKEMEELDITQDMTIEIKVELNLILLIPMVVGALILVIVIIVAIVKGSRNSGVKRISGKSNMEAFDKLNQRNQAADSSKKSDKPYNPYIDNGKK